MGFKAFGFKLFGGILGSEFQGFGFLIFWSLASRVCLGVAFNDVGLGISVLGFGTESFYFVDGQNPAGRFRI